MHNLKILIVGKETFMYPFYYLIDDFAKDNDIASLWVNHMESELDECDLNRSTYYAYQKKEIKSYTLHYSISKFMSEYNNGKIDFFKLYALEDKYSFYKYINMQLLSDQLMSKCYHNRDLYQEPTYEQQLLWIQCVYENIEQILDDFEPDVILDCDIAELPRTLLNEVAHKREIPYISIAYARYEMFKIPSYSLNIGVEGYFFSAYKSALEEDNSSEIKYVNQFRSASSIKNSTYLKVGNPTYAYQAEPLIDTLKSIYGIGVYLLKQDKTKKNKMLKKQNPVLFANSKKFMKFWIKSRLFRRWLYRTKTLFDDPVAGEPYVYMPLHLIPESTTFSMAPFWINELTTIEIVSKSIPAGWRLYVKEHQAMLGERSMEFYKKVKKILNVRLVRFNYYDDPKPWIENARAVITITGTSAYEAALLGKPTFVFGDVPFAVIKGVTRVRAIEDLPKMFRDIRDVKDMDNIKECAAYIKAVRNVGRSVDLENIMNKAYWHLTQGKELDEDFWKEIENLRSFFEDAYEHAEERVKLGTVRIN